MAPDRVQFVALSQVGFATLATAAIVAYAGSLTLLGLREPDIATVVCVGLAALLSSVAGFAFSPICGAMLFHFRQDPVSVVQIMLVCSVANQALSVWVLRREVRLAALLPFLQGGLFGVPAGAWLLTCLDAAVYRKGLGALLLAYATYMLVRPPFAVRCASRAADVLAGFVGGVVGGFAATPGAPVSIWCSATGWDKVRQRALYQPFILLMQLAALAAIALMHRNGAPSVHIPPLAWACVPAGLAGTRCGLGLFHRLNDRQFGLALNLLLLASGAGLLL